MTIMNRLRAVGRSATVVAMAVAAAAGLAVAGSGVAHANSRETLRPDATGTCDWDAAQHWVQRCDVWSESMGRNVPVLVQPARAGGNAGFYLLDGMRADDNFTGWTVYSNAQQAYVDTNITLVMPVGGAGSFYSDWENSAAFSSEPVTYKWETFLTAELPGYLQQHFGVSPTNNSIAGLSMGGTAALNLAARHPNQFRQALSYSGYLHTTAPGMQTLLRLALLETGGFNLNAMYGSITNPRRFENDPFHNMEGLHNADVYISAATGAWAPEDHNLPLDQRFMGAGLEFLSRATTQEWEREARSKGLNPTTHYPAVGIHNWRLWTDELWRTRDRVLDVMQAR
ncbi:alpha/beta hydrolase family protein [Corynebacterium sp.]|uniref:alpha/beta hydrolase n=1 Tax=Corynebacterium sp. TaxID=1720 RepID=UPI0026DDC46F|nr:alpha/beta hydrolase family protein [Corynebacterium sp.]MDO5076727.1 alpha/beta hydrolase family protein [Corynebacterium sp.]